MKVFLSLAALFVVVSAQKLDPSIIFGVIVRLGKNFKKQHGSISVFEDSKWWYMKIITKLQIVDDEEFVPLIPKEDVTGSVSLDRPSGLLPPFIEFQWKSNSENAGPIRVNVIQLTEVNPNTGGKVVRNSYCHWEVIHPGPKLIHSGPKLIGSTRYDPGDKLIFPGDKLIFPGQNVTFSKCSNWCKDIKCLKVEVFEGLDLSKCRDPSQKRK